MGEDCPYVIDGYTEAQLYLKDKIEIRGPGGMYTNLGNLFTLHYYKVHKLRNVVCFCQDGLNL